MVNHGEGHATKHKKREKPPKATENHIIISPYFCLRWAELCVLIHLVWYLDYEEMKKSDFSFKSRFKW